MDAFISNTLTWVQYWFPGGWGTGFVILHYSLVVIIIARVMVVRRPVGSSLAWLSMAFLFPLLGFFLYILFGERNIGRSRRRRAQTLSRIYRRWILRLIQSNQLPRQLVAEPFSSISRMAERVALSPAVGANQLKLFDHASSVFHSLVIDIQQARKTCHLEYYLWSTDGEIAKICQALIEASQRGVQCRLLLDGVGGKPFLKSPLADQMRQHGIQIEGALPLNIFRMLYRRMDLRIHRKFVVIDSEIAYTGSLNMVDPRFFKKNVGVGQWVDAMVRVKGPAALGLDILFHWDWEIERGERIDDRPLKAQMKYASDESASTVQVIPSGPGYANQTIQELLIAVIYAAQKKLVITTPYFVPDEGLLMAIKTAAARGVVVKLIVPHKVDSRMVRHASHAYYEELMERGVQIYHYDRGLLHTKSITVDDKFSVIGTVNLDMRSFLLNFEVSLFVYDNNFTAQLLELQQLYMDDSQRISLSRWRQRSVGYKVMENFFHLLAPVL